MDNQNNIGIEMWQKGIVMDLMKSGLKEHQIMNYFNIYHYQLQQQKQQQLDEWNKYCIQKRSISVPQIDLNIKKSMEIEYDPRELGKILDIDQMKRLELIKKWKDQLKISHRKIAEFAGVSTWIVSKFLNGKPMSAHFERKILIWYLKNRHVQNSNDLKRHLDMGNTYGQQYLQIQNSQPLCITLE